MRFEKQQEFEQKSLEQRPALAMWRQQQTRHKRRMWCQLQQNETNTFACQNNRTNKRTTETNSKNLEPSKDERWHARRTQCEQSIAKRSQHWLNEIVFKNHNEWTKKKKLFRLPKRASRLKEQLAQSQSRQWVQWPMWRAVDDTNVDRIVHRLRSRQHRPTLRREREREKTKRNESQIDRKKEIR